MENLGAKEEIFLVDMNVVNLRTRKGVSVQRAKETVTQMLVVLEILFVEVTTVGTISKMPRPMMTVAPPPAIMLIMEVKLEA